MEIRTRPSTGAIVMSLDTFKAADHGELCTRLGLSSEQPYTRADGSRYRRPRRRRRRQA